MDQNCKLCLDQLCQTHEEYFKISRNDQFEPSTDLIYECGVCIKKFSTKSKRRKHEKSHALNRIFRCVPCGDRFLTSTDLAAHRAWGNHDKHLPSTSSTKV